MSEGAGADDTQLRVLLALRVRGFAAPDAVVESTGLPEGAVTACLDELTEREQVKSRSGRVSGYTLTPAGRSELTQLLSDASTDEQQAAVSAAYDAFLGPNGDFKQMTTDRQTGADTDTEATLQSIDGRLDGILTDLEKTEPRFGAYRPRFVRARDAFLGGDADALAKPMSGSYHDVWMELHEDLLATLGRERDDADG